MGFWQQKHSLYPRMQLFQAPIYVQFVTIWARHISSIIAKNYISMISFHTTNGIIIMSWACNSPQLKSERLNFQIPTQNIANHNVPTWTCNIIHEQTRRSAWPCGNILDIKHGYTWLYITQACCARVRGEVGRPHTVKYQLYTKSMKCGCVRA